MSTLLTQLENGILIVTINRPDKLNALNAEVFKDLNAILDDIYQNNAIQSVIITGAGNKAFVAGADISEFNQLNKAGAAQLAKAGQDTFFRIENSPKPIVACVNGFALGGGCELAMSCHFRIASENAKFGQPEVNLGLIPGYGGTQRLVQLIGKGRALELILTAAMIDAQKALEFGLVNAVVQSEKLIDAAKERLQIINSKAPIAIAKCIEAVNAVFDETKNGYSVEANAFADSFDTKDRIEGTTAFLEKRKAIFKGN